MAQLTIAVAKGYLFSEALDCLKKCNFTFDDHLENSRKLYIESQDKQLKLLIVRPWDVPAYVAQGAADLGVVGHDVLQEQSPHVYQLMDLKFGQCKLVIAGPKGSEQAFNKPVLKVATKYPNATEAFLKKKGIKSHIIKLYGAIELAPLTGLSDVISDLTATGQTLKEHDLTVLDTVFSSTAYLIANPIGFKQKYTDITRLIQRLQTVIA